MARVLVIEDERGIRLTQCAFLGDADHEVLSAEDAEGSWRILEQEAVDVIVTDMVLPKVHGPEHLRRLRALAPGVPIIVVTGEPGLDTASAAVQIRAFDYVSKPVPKERLLSIVNTAAREKEREDEHERLAEENRRYRERLEQLVEERARQLAFQSSVLEQIGDLVMATDLEGRITYVNAAEVKRLGHTREELLGGTVHTFGEDPARGATQDEIIRRTREEGSWRGEVVNTAADGSEHIMAVYTWLMQDAQGKATGMCGVSHDVTEQRRAEEALRAERWLMDQYLDAAASIVVALNRDGRIVRLNKTGARILECEKDEAIDTDWFERFVPERIRARVREVFDALMAGDIEPVEYFENPVITAKGNERIIRWHNSVIRDQAGRIVGTLSSGEDVTGRR